MSDKETPDGIASGENLRRAQRAGSVERVRLPRSGLTVLLARPSLIKAMEFDVGLREHGQKLTCAAATQTPNASDVIAAFDYANGVLTYVFESPGFSREVEQGKITFGDLF